jgi:hypothetical protein
LKIEILNNISDLGGDVSQVKGVSLQADFAAIRFKHSLYETDFGDEFYGVDDFYAANKSLYLTNKEQFYVALMQHFYANPDEIKAEMYYGQMLFRNTLFTPFVKGTFDFDEWNQSFADENQVNLSEIYKVSKNRQPDFMFIAFNYGYPENFFICLSDQNPENPTVFGMDRETFYGEITNEGNLEDFFKRFITKDAFLKMVQHYIDSKKDK